MMSFFRQIIAPLLIVLVFLFALLVVSIRIFLPADMAAPAPVGEEVGAAPALQMSPDAGARSQTNLPDALSVLVEGMPDASPGAVLN